jgi:N4-gp56 family major capsid protein
MVAVNTQTTYAADVSNFIQKEKLPLVQRQLVLYQFGQSLRLPKQRGLSYQATRYDRTNLPLAPLTEGVPPTGETIPIATVSVTAQQWGDTITVTDIADFSIEHPLFVTAKDLIAMNAQETLERNTANALMANTQINYVNSRGARASLVAGDVMNSHEVGRMVTALRIIGAAEFNGQMEEDSKVTAGKPSMASKDPKGFSHYVAVCRPEVEADLRENSTVVLAWANSDINRLYNNELGYWAGVRWVRSNMMPYFVGNAAPNNGGGASDEGSYTAASTGGSLAAGTYFVQIVGALTQLGYETLVGAASGSITVGGSGSGSISITTPNVTGYNYLVYLDTVAAPVHLGVSSAGPSVGPLAGQAVGIAPNTTITLTSVGVSRTPPAAPAEDVIVFPTFVFGKDAYGQVMLDDMKFYFLDKAEKIDPLNQLYMVGWKCMWNTIILNNNFMGRIESTSNFSSAFG